jgi:hypothetical protein
MYSIYLNNIRQIFVNFISYYSIQKVLNGTTRIGLASQQENKTILLLPEMIDLHHKWNLINYVLENNLFCLANEGKYKPVLNGSDDDILRSILLGFCTLSIISYSEQNTFQKPNLLPSPGEKVGSTYSGSLHMRETDSLSEMCSVQNTRQWKKFRNPVILTANTVHSK